MRKGFQAAAILAAVAGLGLAQAALGQPREISVTGEGQVQAAPDMASLSLGVTAQSAEAQAAMSESAARMRSVMGALEAAGIAPRDMQTRTMSVSPLREDGGAVSGFEARNMLDVRIRQLDALGGVLDAVLAEGANALSGLRFELSDRAAAQDEALRRAVADARARAKLLADAAEVDLGPVRSIRDSAIQDGPEPMMRAQMAPVSEGVPLAEGEITISASVSMVFSLGE